MLLNGFATEKGNSNRGNNATLRPAPQQFAYAIVKHVRVRIKLTHTRAHTGANRRRYSSADTDTRSRSKRMQRDEIGQSSCEIYGKLLQFFN